MERLEILPNAFYDAIVFITPSILLAVGLVVGFSDLINWTQVLSIDWGVINVLVLGVGVWVLGYEYGRIAEAWSSPIVQHPLTFISRKTPFLNSPDFNITLVDQVRALNLEFPDISELGSKWTIYFFALLVSPRLGIDLLKRYAWEKLSRSSAFTFVLLLLVSIVFHVLQVTGYTSWPHRPWTFGSLELTLTLFLFTFLTYYEYYRRNCWNNDLLAKVLPVLIYAGQMEKEKNSYVLDLRNLPTIKSGISLTDSRSLGSEQKPMPAETKHVARSFSQTISRIFRRRSQHG